ncbi:FAD-dependent monooxygenase [Salinarimonas ramus]|uniref:2-octaprenyl-6-methoxyphenyl hydroxylase n=1 Tax=Salinarimonas ramus TaxID=690164 RepID=A0A917QA50_9HYPH|nr:FAD-dependent monooxygenase [Salinarimonas ramus]GGK39251.1 2-octaprenyl-6-methoxyphenyl hydroxylase [Salinarimonas ramus]
MTNEASKATGWRIVVAGGGIVGLALSLALARAAPRALCVTLCDPALGRDPAGDRRAYAIAAGSRRMLSALDVWAKVAGDAQEMREMVITDSHLADPVRPVFLEFGGEADRGDADEPFAHMVEGAILTRALRDACREAGVEMLEAGVRRATPAADGTRSHVRLTDGTSVEADLVCAADGKRSRLREGAGIGWSGWDYPQSGLSAIIGHARDHEGRAIQHFLPSGPFAILPLTPSGSPRGTLGHRSAIVWSERKANVPHMLALDADFLLEEIERRFGLELGAIALETPVQAFPLEFGLARAFVGTRLALVGDAAHVVHPIAGQGVNLGLKDAAILAERIVSAVRLGMDPGAADVLEDYQRARRADTVAMGLATDALNRLFSNDVAPVRMLRDLGLGLVDRMPAAKRFFMREAAGVPKEGGARLLRGEAL